MPFSLDYPQTDSLDRVTRFSGWCYGDDGALARSFIVSVDGHPLQSLGGLPRVDIGAAFPDVPYAGASGFMGDLVLPDSIAEGTTVEVAITADLPAGLLEIHRGAYCIGQPPAPPAIRRRGYDLAALLRDSETGEQGGSKPQGPFDPTRRLVAGTQHFHLRGGLPWIRLFDPGPTHPYGKRSRELIGELPRGGVFLDLGCGIKDDTQIIDNAVLLDAVHFRGVDVVNTCQRLPFRD